MFGLVLYIFVSFPGYKRENGLLQFHYVLLFCAFVCAFVSLPHIKKRLIFLFIHGLLLLPFNGGFGALFCSVFLCVLSCLANVLLWLSMFCFLQHAIRV